MTEFEMKATIRPADSNDVDAIVALNRIVQSLHADLDPEHFKPVIDQATIDELFRSAIGDRDSLVLLAHTGSAAVGYIWAEIQERPETAYSPHRRRTYVHHLVVRDDARRTGVASALMRAVEDQSRALGVSRIVLDAWATNESAQGYFRAQGFRALSVVLSKTF